MAVDKDKQKEIIDEFSNPTKGLWEWLTGKKKKKKKYSKRQAEEKMKKQYRA
jgi:hypothetical protein